MIKTLTIAVAIALSLPTLADAASYNCGRYMSRVFGVANTPLALDWARKFPRTSAHPGAVVVQTRNGRALGGSQGGHVSKIIRLTGTCRAIVNDNRGTYERDICKRLVAYVDPNGNAVHEISARSHKRRQVAEPTDYMALAGAGPT